MTELLREYWFIPLIACIPLILRLLHILYSVVLPQRAVNDYGEADPERLRRYLERVLKTPSIFGQRAKMPARLHLIKVYFHRGDHAKIVTLCRANLACLAASRNTTGNDTLEADARRRLAESLDILGKSDEAKEERRLAAEALDRAPADTLGHLTQGMLLQRQNRNEESYNEFLQALEQTPQSQTAARIECTSHLSIAAYNTGRPVECLRWANETIDLGATGRLLRTACRMAAVACGSLSRLEESEHFYRRTYDVAVTENNTAEMAQSLGNLAYCVFKRGKLFEANEMCVKSAAMSPKAVHLSLVIQSSILREWGRYDDALAIRSRFEDSLQITIPDLRRRSLAVSELDTARIAAEAGQGERAWPHIQNAIAQLSNDAKLGLTCQGACAWVLAVRGLADESRSLAAQLEPCLTEFERDPGTCRGVLFDLGMAACVRGDYQSGIDLWTRYLSLSPDPVYHPTAYYQRGECQRELGELSAAQNDYRAAVAMNLDTHHTNLARFRLSGF